MLPIRLTFVGLNSYANKVNIDFTKFHPSKLFGIFGSTGGGKSTILDAMILSIYGKTPRLKDKITEAINPRRKSIEIEFIFESSGERFEIHRYIGEKDKKKIKLYKLTPKRIAIAEKESEFQQKIQEIIGLSYDEFLKVVILPQNEFAEVLKQKPANRAVLIGNLFDLNYFGEPLFNKFSEMYLKYEANIIEKQRRLDELSGISQESISAKEKEAEKIDREVQTLRDNLNEIVQKLNMLKNFKQLSNQKKELEKKLREIEEKRTEIENLRKRIQLDETLSPYKKLILDLSNLSSSIERNLQQLSILERELKLAETNLDKIKKEKEDFENYFSEKNKELISKIKETEQLQEIEKEIKELLEKLKQKESKLRETETELKKVSEEFKKLETETTNLTKQRDKINEELKRVQLSQSELSLYERLPRALLKISEIATLKAEIENLTRKIDTEKQIEQDSFKKIKNKLKDRVNLSIAKFEEAEETILAKTRMLRDKREILQQSLDELKAKDTAYLLSKTLIQGKPCPVCGSTYHPYPARSIDKNQIDLINQSLKEIDESIKILDELRVEINPQMQRVLKARTNSETYEKEIQEKTTKLSNAQELLRQILEEKYWSDAESLYEQLKKKRDKTDKLMIELNKLTSELHEKMNRKIEISNKHTQLNSEINQIRNEITELNSNLESKKNEHYHKTSGKTSLEIRQETEKELINLKLKRENFEKKLKEINEKVQNLRISTEKLKETIHNERERYHTISLEIENKAKQIGVEAHKLSSLMLNETERKQFQTQIEEFERKINTTKGALDNIEKNLNQLQIKDFEDSLIESTERQISELTDKINRFNETLGTLKEQIKTEISLLREKQNLANEIEALKKDFENIKILKSLTYGKEMVKFFSWHLLKEVVTLANKILINILGRRFHLKVNSNLEFYVIDLYYNNERSVNTLSGGETFVVSFALALALSSYIQKKRRKVMQFFFIDEGFSSLDKELIDAVSTVLNQLKSQDRLVGFITHVNEIKQLIPYYIEVKKDITGSSTLRLNV